MNQDINNIESAGSVDVYGARVHNLKNIDVTIPHNSLSVITGLSGSGKSSLAFDTIFAEGQRRYIETFSSYARNMFTTKQQITCHYSPDAPEELPILRYLKIFISPPFLYFLPSAPLASIT